MKAEEVIGVLFSLTAISSYINYRYLKLPKSIGLTLITLLLSLVFAGLKQCGFQIEGYANTLLETFGFNETFMHGMLGFLIFAASLHINALELQKHSAIVGLLATVSVLLSTFFVGFASYGLTQVLNFDIPLEYCLVFGALISPTDPISTLAILKKVHAPKALEMKIAGEALFNDGMAIVLFVILLGMATGKEVTWNPQNIIWFVFREGVGGLILGLVMGWLAARLLRSINNYEVATIITLALVTGGYTFADSVNVSGAICMAAAGLVVGGQLQNGHMSKETILRLDAFWELLDEILNAILFVLIGLEFVCLHFTWNTILLSLGAIIITIAARWVSVSIPVASLALFKKFNPNVILVMTWGGLRGGISIALALSVPEPARDFILTITYSVVLFSITVQGLSIGKLVKTLSRKQGKEALDPSHQEANILPEMVSEKPKTSLGL